MKCKDRQTDRQTGSALLFNYCLATQYCVLITQSWVSRLTVF